MAEKQIDSQQAMALSGSTDSRTGVKYPAVGEDPWAESFYRMADQLRQVAALSNNLRPYIEDTLQLSVGVRAGIAWLAGAAHDYQGSVVSGLVNNDTSYLWMAIDDGAPSLEHGLKSVGWPDTEHLPLAEIVTAAGEIQTLSDQRGLGLWSRRHASRQQAGLMLQVESDADSSLLIDHSGGVSGASMIQVVSDPGDSPATADLLRDELVDSTLPEIRNAIATLASHINLLVSDLNGLRQKMRDAGVLDA